MATSRSGSGGRIIMNRRNQRLAATTYDRTPLQKSPNWFAGVLVPSARAIASGAGKILSFIFSDSGSSSSEDEEYASDKFDFSEMTQYRQQSQLQFWRSETETKRIIEHLIMNETFSREERDRLIKLLNSRTIEWSMEVGENSVASSPENFDSFDKAVEEARRWFREKNVGLNCSVTELAHGTPNLNSAPLEHVESRGGSPAAVARSYMDSRAPWAYSWRNIEFKTPLTDVGRLQVEKNSEDGGESSKLGRELKRLQSSVNYNRRKEKRMKRTSVRK